MNKNGIKTVKNCFLMSTEQDQIIDKGSVRMDMLEALQLERIQVGQLPAKRIFKYYLGLKRMKVDELKL